MSKRPRKKIKILPFIVEKYLGWEQLDPEGEIWRLQDGTTRGKINPEHSLNDLFEIVFALKKDHMALHIDFNRMKVKLDKPDARGPMHWAYFADMQEMLYLITEFVQKGIVYVTKKQMHLNK